MHTMHNSYCKCTVHTVHCLVHIAFNGSLSTMHSAQCIMHIVLGVNTDQCIPNPHPHCCKIYFVTLLHIVDRCNVSCIMYLAALHCCASSKNVPSDLCIFTVHFFSSDVHLHSASSSTCILSLVDLHSASPGGVCLLLQ